jgi:hypothetical protein
MANDEITVEGTAKFELFGIGAGIEVSRKWSVDGNKESSFRSNLNVH